MRFVVILLVTILLNSTLGERLPDHRKSCVYGKVRKTSPDKERDVIVQFPLPNDWDQIFMEELEARSRPKREYVREKLQSGTVYEGFKLSTEVDEKKASIDSVRLAIHDILHNNRIRKEFRDKLYPFVYAKLEKSYDFPEPFIRIDEKVRVTHFLQSYSRDVPSYITLTVRVLAPEYLETWMCDDIGGIVNGSYVVYETPLEWMVETEIGGTVILDINYCVHVKNHAHTFFCQSKAFGRNANCSVNNIENCGKSTYRPESVKHSVARSLHDGVAVFGNFLNWEHRYKNTTRNNFNVVNNPRLVYFSFLESPPWAPNKSVIEVKRMHNFTYLGK